MTRGWPASLRQSACRGFSVLELLITLGLLVALGAIVLVPADALFERARFDGDLHRLRGALTECRVLARRLGVPVRIELEPGRLVARLWTADEQEDDETPPILTVMLGETRDDTGTLLEDSQPITVALPDGTFCVGNQMSLAHTDGDVSQILFDTWSGAVRIDAP